MGERHYYLDLYTDEVLPCASSLEAWAAWLASEDESWPHAVPADGDTFKATTLDELATVTARKVDGKWTLDPEPPAEATGFVLRNGRAGWDGETWSDTPLGYFEANDDGLWWDDGSEEEVVCTACGPNLVLRFEAAGPALVVLTEVQ